MNGVSQDSGKLKQIAEYIDGEAIKFQNPRIVYKDDHLVMNFDLTH